MENVGVILAAGSGLRFNSNVPKQYMKLNGLEVVAYSINAFRECAQIDRFIVVVDDQEFKAGNIERKYNVTCIGGGETRNHSIYNAITYVRDNIPGCKKILFHDAARPFIRSDILDIYYSELDYFDAVITAAHITDSIGRQGQWIVDRSEYHLIQTPEAFAFDILLDSFSPSSDTTAIIQQLPSDSTVKKHFGFKNNIKITYPEDLFLAEQLIKLTYYRKVPGPFDYSKLGKILVLGGNGGIGSQLVKDLAHNKVEFVAPSHQELDLECLTIEKLDEYLGEFKPDTIINLAATSKSDSDGILRNFGKVFRVNLKANLVLIRYAERLGKKVNLVLLSSSATTKGRENITLYSASKVALNSVIESLSRKMAEKEVFINGIIPEKINTPLIQKLHKKSINANEMLEVDEVLDAILYFSVCNEHGQLVHIRRGLAG